ncbi:hypothetical protein C2G38_2037881 [Gigaspora rosea]|uniref:Uncharacterized protein n=1 Tax=Gigaspora rosea TaxID=44941 RepID=A0A397V481_9GLOM|nr:hypothetical protein C2G38_2037881 [Gigaspora rosea]
MGTSLRIPGVKDLIKGFARVVHGRNSCVILVNATDVVNKGWNGIIDYQIKGTCDEWVKLVDLELLNGKRIPTMIPSKNNYDNTNIQTRNKRKQGFRTDLSSKKKRN